MNEKQSLAVPHTLSEELKNSILEKQMVHDSQTRETKIPGRRRTWPAAPGGGRGGVPGISRDAPAARDGPGLPQDTHGMPRGT